MAYSRNSPSRMKIKSDHKSEYADAPFVTEAWTSWGYRQSVSKAGQGRAGHGRAWQGRAGQGRAGQGRAGQGRAGQGRAGQGRAGQGQQPQAAVVDIQQTMQRMTIAVQAC